jgi:hypothetical protein
MLADSETVKEKVKLLFFGSYDFTAPKPWLQLVANQALDISEKEIEEQTKPFLSTILKEQKNKCFTLQRNRNSLSIVYLRSMLSL